MKAYLAEATDFTDMTVKDRPDQHRHATIRYQPHDGGTWIICPKCHGYGGWNLELNAYRRPQGLADNTENRSNFVHFQSGCSQCNGWGWVSDASTDATCLHQWLYSSSPGRCLHTYTCRTCHASKTVDSSD